MKIVKLCFLFGAVAAMTVASAAQAASITWGSPVQIAGTSDVSTNGTLVQALNFVGTSAQMVNGVTFAAAPVNIFLLDTDPQVWGDVSVSSKPGTWTQFLSQIGSTATTNDAAYDAMLEPGMFEGQPAHGGDILTINNLAAGVTYEVQFWSNDSRNIAVLAGRVTTFQDVTSGNVVTVPQNAGLATLGSHLTGTVVGDGTPLEIHLDTVASSWLLNAMQIRAVPVPEPTTLGLGLVSICMSLLATRRR